MPTPAATASTTNGATPMANAESLSSAGPALDPVGVRGEPRRAPASTPRARRSRPNKARAAWIPKQHGAWAMLTVPLLVGAIRSGWSLAHVPLTVCWIVGYLGFAAAGLWLRSGRKEVYLTPVLVYAGVSLVAGLALLALRPELAWWAPVFAPFAAVSLWYSSRRRDRALGNDVVTILAASLMTLVAASAGRLGETGNALGAAVSDAPLVGSTLALALYFVGTSLYVKTLIRERGSRAYRWASIGYHAAATVLWAVVPSLLPAELRPPQLTQGLLVAFFAVTTARAAVLAGRRIRPMKVGLGEIALSVALALILLAW